MKNLAYLVQCVISQHCTWNQECGLPRTQNVSEKMHLKVSGGPLYSLENSVDKPKRRAEHSIERGDGKNYFLREFPGKTNLYAGNNLMLVIYKASKMDWNEMEMARRTINVMAS